MVRMRGRGFGAACVGLALAFGLGGSCGDNMGGLFGEPVMPHITAQPADAVALEGQSATFRVEAMGSGTLTYQWRLNSFVIAGATSSSYTTPALALADSGGHYDCVVSNAPRVGDVEHGDAHGESRAAGHHDAPGLSE
jgi:hypothetical protein